MGSTSKYGRARIDPNAPEALGICDRCGGLYNLKNLHYQWDWCGTGMVNKQLRVCRGAGTRGCYDAPQPQLRAIILPPDPPPARGVRPEPYEVDEQNHLTLRQIIGNNFMFPGGQSSMAAVLTTVSNLAGFFTTISSFVSAIVVGKTLSASMSVTSEMTAVLTIPAIHLLTESGDIITTESGDQLIIE